VCVFGEHEEFVTDYFGYDKASLPPSHRMYRHSPGEMLAATLGECADV